MQNVVRISNNKTTRKTSKPIRKLLVRTVTHFLSHVENSPHIAILFISKSSFYHFGELIDVFVI